MIDKLLPIPQPGASAWLCYILGDTPSAAISVLSFSMLSLLMGPLSAIPWPEKAGS